MKTHAPTRVVAACILALAAIFGAATGASASSGPTHARHSHPVASHPHAAAHGWVGSWAAAPMAPTPLAPNLANAGFSDQTVRNIVFTTAGGDQARFRVSNEFGTQALQIDRASIGVVLTGAQLGAGTSHPVTFGGQASVTVPAGAEILSDPVSMPVKPSEDLAVSLYVPAATGPATYHKAAQQTSYVAAGDQADATAATAYTTTDTSWYFLDGLEVHDPAASGTVVAIGDSITDGHTAQIGANDRWPNDLARRLQAARGPKAPAVVDAGIGGNRVLHDSACFGVNALTRFPQDVLDQPGAKDVIVLEGINDIGFSQGADVGCSVPNTTVTAGQIEAGYRQLIAMAHARGLKIFGGTLTPFKGTPHWTAAAEAKREAVNNWIRTSHAFDGVIDFAGAVQSPVDPLYYDPAYNSGDNLHPNDAGYSAMAAAINLAPLK